MSRTKKKPKPEPSPLDDFRTAYFLEDERDAAMDALQRRLSQIRKRYSRPMSAKAEKATGREYVSLLSAWDRLHLAEKRKRH